MAAAARRRYAEKNLQFETCDVTKGLPLPSASIDVVTSFMMLHNLLSKQLHLVFSEVHRILRPDGTAVFLTMHPDAFESDWDLKFLSYDAGALCRYRAALEPEDLEIPGRAVNAGGGENAIVTIYHARASVLGAVHRSNLVLADERDLWIDALTAVEVFGSDTVHRPPQTAVYWMIVLKKSAER
jgi:SAM-dependent methyltransferase